MSDRRFRVALSFADYEKKAWCGLESRGWRSVLKEDDRIMFRGILSRVGQASGAGGMTVRVTQGDASSRPVQRSLTVAPPCRVCTRYGGATVRERCTGTDEAFNRARSIAPHRLSVQHLPSVNPTLFGRDSECGRLDGAWSNFVQIVPPGGRGKSALTLRPASRQLYQESATA
jgi:hypothetical protein